MRLEQIWHLRNVGKPEDNWEFSANYKLPIENSVLRNLLQGETKPPIRLSDHPDLLKLVRVLVKEVRERTEGQIEIGEGAFAVKARRQLEQLMRKPTSPGRERVVICIGDVVGPGGRKLQEFQEQPSIPDLSSASSDAVFGLDRLAAESCYRIFGDKARSLDGYPPEAIPTCRNVLVFIAYRRTYFDAAKRLYDVLLAAGEGTLFNPYLDYHSMQLGDWQEQIFDQIEKADIFMPVVSHDYAEPGSFGHKELMRAREVAKRRQLDDFFAPVFLGEVRSQAGLELRSFDGFEAASEQDLSSENRALYHWLGRAVSAGLGRDPV
jgi:hypothetical protein